MAYRTSMPRLLRFVGWEVESDEFAEIVDPDPDNHEGRQRQLIREIEDARKEAQEKPEKRRFGFWKRGKLAEKKSWEMYDEKMAGPDHQTSGAGERPSSNVLFDIEAIKRELESEHMEIRQLESTLPPMQIDLNNHKSTSNSSQDLGSGPKTDKIPQESFSAPLRSTKSFDAAVLPSHNDSTEQPPIEKGSSESLSPVRTEDQTFTSIDEHLTPPRQSQNNSPLPAPGVAWQENSKNSARPELKSASTAPLEKNAWVEEEEDPGEWNKEREVVMSFE